MEVPDGWLQLIRGPRPKSEKWLLKARQKPAPAVRQTGRQRQGSIQGCRPTSAEPRGSQAKPQPRRAVEGSAGSSGHILGSNCGDWRRGSRSCRSGRCEPGEPIHRTNKSSGGDSFVESKDRTGASKRSKMCATSFVDLVPSCASRLRLAEDFVPMCDEDVVRWMQDRQADMQEATLAGNPHEVARLCCVMGTAATSWSTVTMPPSTVSNAVQR